MSVTVNTSRNTITIAQGGAQTTVQSQAHKIILGSASAPTGGLSAYAMAQLNGLDSGITEAQFYASLATAAETPTGRYTHTQSSASATWTVNHNLGFRPDIKIFSDGGMEVMAEVVHISLNQAQISFDIPFSGTAVCE